jgi:hypothetical protein
MIDDADTELGCAIDAADDDDVGDMMCGDVAGCGGSARTAGRRTPH